MRADGDLPSKLLTCARSQALMRRAHTRKLGAQINVSFKNVFAHNYYLIQVFPNIDEKVKFCTT